MSEQINPYEIPREPSAPVEDGFEPRAGSVVPFQSGHFRAMCTMTLLAATAVLDLGGIGSSMLEIRLLERIQAGEEITDAEALANDNRQMLVALGGIGLLIATAIAFLMWIHRAHRNLPALGAYFLTYSPGWAVGGFFVPILNLFRPYQVMREIWIASDPQPLRPDAQLVGLTSSLALVNWWWSFWLLMNFVGGASAKIAMRAESIDTFIISGWLDVGCSVLSVIAAILAILVVRGVNANQQQRLQILTDEV